MAFAKISQVAHYAPAQVVTNDDLSKIMDTSDEWIRSRTGIQERRISLNENTSDLATNVAHQLLEKSGLSPEELDFVLVATISPDSSMPSVAARVQGAIGAVNAFAFDITAACSGFVFALATAEKLIKSGVYKKGLVIGAEVLSKTLDWSDRTTAVLFGDGAGGVLLEETEEEHFFGESLNTDGSKGGLESGASAVISPYSDESDQPNPYMQMDGKAIFDFAVKTVSKSIKALVEEKGEPDYFLLHQANIRILDIMAKKIDVSRDKFLANMMSYGNTSAASIPILLSENVANGTLKKYRIFYSFQVLYVYISYQLPQLFFIIVISRIGLDTGFSMEQRIEFFQIYTFFKRPIRWFLTVVNQPLRRIDPITGNTRIGNQRCYPFSIHNRQRITFGNGSSQSLFYVRNRKKIKEA